jgi:hypothetical protein
MVFMQLIQKSLAELLTEVYAGNYQDFRVFIAQTKLQTLDLKISAGELSPKQVTRLGEAISGTLLRSLRLKQQQ